MARPLSLAIVYLSLIGLLIAAGFSIGGRLVNEADSLGNKLPDFFNQSGLGLQDSLAGLAGADARSDCQRPSSSHSVPAAKIGCHI